MNARQVNAGQVNAGQVNAGQVNAGQANAGQANAGQAGAHHTRDYRTSLLRPPNSTRTRLTRHRSGIRPHPFRQWLKRVRATSGRKLAFTLRAHTRAGVRGGTVVTNVQPATRRRNNRLHRIHPATEPKPIRLGFLVSHARLRDTPFAHTMHRHIGVVHVRFGQTARPGVGLNKPGRRRAHEQRIVVLALLARPHPHAVGYVLAGTRMITNARRSAGRCRRRGLGEQ
ncbi:hypothetical protein [Saccharopolyspora elongata]|uniref:hypothetical protein n=1 Tax=Saccharopolyspora elongata TaxID=2530387 RepID=UPI0038B45187